MKLVVFCYEVLLIRMIHFQKCVYLRQYSVYAALEFSDVQLMVNMV